jgi:hypothetical protein
MSGVWSSYPGGYAAAASRGADRGRRRDVIAPRRQPQPSRPRAAAANDGGGAGGGGAAADNSITTTTAASSRSRATVGAGGEGGGVGDATAASASNSSAKGADGDGGVAGGGGQVPARAPPRGGYYSAPVVLRTVQVHFIVAVCDTKTVACSVQLVDYTGRPFSGRKFDLDRIDGQAVKQRGDPFAAAAADAFNGGGARDSLHTGDEVSMFAHLYQRALNVPVDDNGVFRWQVVVARERGGQLLGGNAWTENATHDRRYWATRAFRTTTVSTAPGALRPHAFAVVGDSFDTQMTNLTANTMLPPHRYAEGFARLVPRAAAFLFARDVDVTEVFARQLNDVVIPETLHPTEAATLRSVDPSTELAVLCLRSVCALFGQRGAAAAATATAADTTTLFLRWATTVHVMASQHSRTAIPVTEEAAGFIDTLNARQVGPRACSLVGVVGVRPACLQAGTRART